jgi:hypothetical protein
VRKGGAQGVRDGDGFAASRAVVAATRRRTCSWSAMAIASSAVRPGSLTTASRVNTIIAARRAELVPPVRPCLTDPAFTLDAAAEGGVRDAAPPVQDGDGNQARFRIATRARGR